MKKILMVGTGGTIASEMTAEGLAPELNTEQLLEFLSTVAIYGFPSENCIRNFLHILMSRWQAPKILPHAGRRGLFLLS